MMLTITMITIYAYLSKRACIFHYTHASKQYSKSLPATPHQSLKRENLLLITSLPEQPSSPCLCRSSMTPMDQGCDVAASAGPHRHQHCGHILWAETRYPAASEKVWHPSDGWTGKAKPQSQTQGRKCQLLSFCPSKFSSDLGKSKLHACLDQSWTWTVKIKRLVRLDRKKTQIVH